MSPTTSTTDPALDRLDRLLDDEHLGPGVRRWLRGDCGLEDALGLHGGRSAWRRRMQRRLLVEAASAMPGTTWSRSRTLERALAGRHREPLPAAAVEPVQALRLLGVRLRARAIFAVLAAETANPPAADFDALTTGVHS